MMFFRIQIILCFILLNFYGYTQDKKKESSIGAHFCMTDELHIRQLETDTLYRERTESIKNKTFLLSRYPSKSALRQAGSAYVIPVVVHIIHNNGAENISDQQVIDGIKHMNEAYANLAPFQGPNSVETGIQFCLAKQDASGNYTTGINRVVSTLTDINKTTQDQQLKNLIRWDPTQYVNIWLVKEICSGPGDCDVAGYAYLAAAHGQPYDGIVNEARWFGSSRDNSKVHIHEMGHYLNLYHTFEGGCTNNNCLQDGDEVCDTPPDQSTSPVYPCGAFVNTCTSDANDISLNNPYRPVSAGGSVDQPDMVENYMDYGYQACQNTFTAGQKDRMTIAISVIRKSLLTSKACNNPCLNKITASFTASSILANPGDAVSFSNNSTGANTYQWKVNEVIFSNNIQPSYVFNNIGSYKITLIASNGDVACTEEYSITINVVCAAKASFQAGNTSVNPGGQVVFTNTSVASNTYQWILDGNVISAATNLTQTFPVQGGYTLYLVASSGTCSDTSRSVFVKVGSCDVDKNYIWYFGNYKGLDFTNGAPVAINNGGVKADEGCTVICDAAGQILCYSNGVILYNKNKQPMPNGSGLNGHLSSTQSSLLVPHPGDPNKYYLFTTDAAENGCMNGFCYNLIDMSLDGGLGDIVSKNNILFAPCGEKITAGYHANNKDIWIMSQQNSGSFATYLINSSGLNTTPVLSATGTNTFNDLGAMKISNSGKKMAVDLASYRGTEIYDFDNSTGIVSNRFSIQYNDNPQPYDLEFSPDDSKLYVTSIQNNHLWQYDLSAGSPTDILNSKFIIETDIWHATAGIALGPDGKIYLNSSQDGVSVINDPNKAGSSCNFSYSAIHFNIDPSDGYNEGMPNMIRNLNRVKINGPDTVCAQSKNIVYKVYNSSIYSSFKWLIQSSHLASQAGDSVLVNFNHAGKDTLFSLVDYSGCPMSGNKEIYISPALLLDLGADTMFCSLPVYKVLNAGPGMASYEWQDHSMNQTYAANAVGTYKVVIMDQTGCKGIDSISLLKNNLPAVNLTDAEICEGEIHIFDAGSGYQYKWQDNTSAEKYTAYLPGKYWVTISDNICTVSDTAFLKIKSMPLVTFTGLSGSFCSSDNPKELTGNPTGGVFSGKGIINNVLYPDQLEVGNYPVTYTYLSPNGCIGINNQYAVVKDTCNKKMMIPNLITPNKDQLNDYFEIQGLTTGFTLEIYNGWNQQVYKKSMYDNTWEAEGLESGVYYYVLYDNKKSMYKGWVEVVK